MLDPLTWDCRICQITRAQKEQGVSHTCKYDCCNCANGDEIDAKDTWLSYFSFVGMRDNRPLRDGILCGEEVAAGATSDMAWLLDGELSDEANELGGGVALDP